MMLSKRMFCEYILKDFIIKENICLDPIDGEKLKELAPEIEKTKHYPALVALYYLGLRNELPHIKYSNTLISLEPDLSISYIGLVDVIESLPEKPRRDYRKNILDVQVNYDSWEYIPMNHKDPKTQCYLTKCELCSKPFVANNRRIGYCDRIAPEFEGIKQSGNEYRCSSVGTRRKFQSRLHEDEDLAAYNRAYKTHFARVKNGKMTETAFIEWRITAKIRLSLVRQGKLDSSDFKKWLKE